MTSPGVGLGFGIRRLLDSNQRLFQGTSAPVFYVMQNFDVSGQHWANMGFTFTPSTPSANTGTTSIKVVPPPSSISMTLKQIAEANKFNLSLRTGARMFQISHTWVKMVQRLRAFTNPRQIFMDKSIVGFQYDNMLFQIVSYVHNDVFSDTVDWIVLCNASELSSTLNIVEVAPGTIEQVMPAGTYTFNQGTPASVWSIRHSLGIYPVVNVVGTDGNPVSPGIHYDSLYQVTLSFSEPFAGTATLIS